jgi:hypothetical protein
MVPDLNHGIINLFPPVGPNLVYYTGTTSFCGNAGVNEPTPQCGVPEKGSTPFLKKE